jgi:hypothetical protein
MPERKKTRISLIEDICDYIRDISLPERAMLNTLARYANPDGSNVYPGQKLLMSILGIKEREIRNLLNSLKGKGYVVPDGKYGYSNRYRLNIPSMPIFGQVTFEEEEEEDKTEVRLPAVRLPAPVVPETPPTGYYPPGPQALTPEEKEQRNLDLLKTSVDLARRGIMSYEVFMRGGRRKGFSDDYLNWMYDRNTDSSHGHQPEDEPVIANDYSPHSTSQTGIYQS